MGVKFGQLRDHYFNTDLNQYLKNMTTRKLEDKNIRKILKSGDSFAVTIPIEIMNELKWKEKQKVVVKKIRGGFSVKDWKK